MEDSKHLKFLKDLAHTNDKKFTILKAAEELNELSTVLIQSLTKPQNITEEMILAEMADVEVRLITLKELLQITPEIMEYAKTFKVLEIIEHQKTVSNFGKIE